MARRFKNFLKGLDTSRLDPYDPAQDGLEADFREGLIEGRFKPSSPYYGLTEKQARARYQKDYPPMPRKRKQKSAGGFGFGDLAKALKAQKRADKASAKSAAPATVIIREKKTVAKRRKSINPFKGSARKARKDVAKRGVGQIAISLAKSTLVDALGGGASVAYDVVVKSTTNKIDDNTYLKPTVKIAIATVVRYFGGSQGSQFASAMNGETVGQSLRLVLAAAKVQS